MTLKLFISYRSLDSAKVDMLVERLRSLKQADDTPLYDIWQDKHSIQPGEDWWQSIVRGIDDCQIFVYMVSKKSAPNVNCRAELSYARKRNRHILPLALQGEFAMNPVTGRNDLTYWNLIPSELNEIRAQFLFCKGTSFFNKFQRACAVFERRGFRDFPADFPPDPRHASDATTDTGLLYDQACDAAGHMDIPTAEQLFQRLVDWNDRDFGDDAYQWILILRDYDKMVRFDQRTSTQYRVPDLWREYVQIFPKPFVRGIFDPKDLDSRYGQNSHRGNDTVGAQHVAPRQTKKPEPADAGMTADDYFSRGNTCNNQGDFAAAIADFTRAIQLKPDYASVYDYRGIAHLNQGDYAAAIADYTRAIQLEPDRAYIYYNRGFACYNHGDYAAAINDYTRVLQLDPDDSGITYYSRGLARYNQKDYAAAINDYNKAIEISPDYDLAYNDRGNAHLNQGDYAAAIIDYNKAIELNPDYAEAYNNRGLVRYNQGDYTIAINDYTRAIELNPHYAEAYINRGNVYHTQKDYATAINNYTRAIQLNPDFAFAYFNRGNAYLTQKGDTAAAIADYTKAIELKPDYAKAYWNRGNAYYVEGKERDAAKDYRKYEQLTGKLEPFMVDIIKEAGL